MRTHDSSKVVKGRDMGRRKFLAGTGAMIGGAGLATLGFPSIVSGAKGEITLYAWYQVVFRKLIPLFEEETGIRVNNVGGYSKDDEWWAKVQTGESFDIIVPGGNRVPNGIAAGRFHQDRPLQDPELCKPVRACPEAAGFHEGRRSLRRAPVAGHLRDVLQHQTFQGGAGKLVCRLG